ncbi:hypothetical protein A2334_00160 [Candidatus Roizmanbacteria bacterium RIFOXYB2_FULL_38_10]|uniref:Uncharacterized protein n=1 Tax=Candidatus Roizmanbacteria bacterium RIFOXYD1_FULL_38_12 TaxID=1802093 RepID=A0A1F7L297_9BACT|nr:MAG: hypothetical protein A3K47_05705 [Candidatus Roizmanbacteria bacterium RIFOXYA2_FULL_38_14]OGK64238.1 MAG: hypothetical protein A3K27_05705 [Candidatus Roizmanbacteria bacterium RIFOXYA1_FULL_37_12]OGK66084.1 MAG: hypothetical protein A3K38_05705 [Candidatus Roizmanbacteria bacterium RIFOXYB1_FULL_40_23]OGK67649.1 MAG: hypothetical protein A2334_00160 [Candidatus Roizmanbacteria bacterium RIFOXYB2_FULL_38_10]OGK70489.1 MAG: hypothetical protein A3K21_05710 [Candidatus Roizmanbacteria ba
MKNFFVGFLTASIILGVGITAYKLGTMRANPASSLIPTTSPAITQTPINSSSSSIAPTITTSTIDDSEAIKQALIQKNKWENMEIEVTISKNDGTYASGGVREKSSETGGGYFFAIKQEGVWKIVADGNGTISCSSLAPYPSYPISLIPECYDETNGGKVVKR